MVNYSKWASSALAAAENVNGDWKKWPQIASMLEHVSSADGKQYFDKLCSQFNLSADEITNACKENDARGGATILEFVGQDGHSSFASCSSLRYLWHSLEILKLLGQETSGASVVEVGAGYGGLACILSSQARLRGTPLATYEIYDLPEAQQLQKAYLKDVSDLPIMTWRNNTTCGRDLEGSRTLLISNYAISELPESVSEMYAESLFPKHQHGYMAWNDLRMSVHLPSQARIRPEDPQTGSVNTIIDW
jgi:putative sugar O-methyltransferase